MRKESMCMPAAEALSTEIGAEAARVVMLCHDSWALLMCRHVKQMVGDALRGGCDSIIEGRREAQ